MALEVVAEGIEIREQWTSLRELGCGLGQGFYFARPMDVDAALEYLTDPRRPEVPDDDPLPVAAYRDDAS